MAYKVMKFQRNNARDLRRNMTDAEMALWQAIRRKQLGVKFRRQVVLGPYIVDFLCHSAQLVIELDGGQHADHETHDETRSRFIETQGFTVIRFWNNEVLENMDGVLSIIKQQVQRAKPSPARGGGLGGGDPLPVAHSLHHSGHWTGAHAAVTLTYDDRFLRRKVLTTDQSERFLVDLPQTTSLNHGDALELSDGRLIEVIAAMEPLIEITGENLIRLAWHIGNRHTPCQIEPDRLLIQHDHVIRDMLAQLGATLRDISHPFTPEGGAYGHGRTHGHAH